MPVPSLPRKLRLDVCLASCRLCSPVFRSSQALNLPGTFHFLTTPSPWSILHILNDVVRPAPATKRRRIPSTQADSADVFALDRSCFRSAAATRFQDPVRQLFFRAAAAARRRSVTSLHRYLQSVWVARPATRGRHSRVGSTQRITRLWLSILKTHNSLPGS